MMSALLNSIPAMALGEIASRVNGARSSIPSPTPMKCTGKPYFADSATRMPPRAVPSSFVITRPVTPAVFRKASTCDRAFWPTVASSTSSTACGASASTFFMTRTTFSSSFISSALFCSRPAVSISSTSMPSAFAAVSASKARPAESAPCPRAITGALVRSPQIFSCSTAAARNVSPAASITLRPSARNFEASLPIVVVLPEPLTPMTRMTNGFCAASITSGFATADEHLLDLGRDHGLHLVGGDRLVVAALADRRGDPRRHLGAEIGAQQHVLDLVDHRPVELALGDEIGHGGAERTRGPLQPVGKAAPPALFRLILSAVAHVARVIAVSSP